MIRLVEFFSVAVPKIVGGACTVAVNLVLLRYFGPEQFGVYALCVAGILLADGIVGSAVDMGVLRLAPVYRSSDPQRSFQVESAAVWLKLGAFLAVWLLLVLFAEPVSARLFGPAGSASLLYLSCAAAAGMLLLRSAQVHAQVEGRFQLYGALECVHAVLKFGGIALLLLFFEASPKAVLSFFVLGPMGALLLWMGFSGLRFTGAWRLRPAVFGELLGFVKWTLLTFGFAALISRLDLFLVASLSSIQETGIFSGAQVFASIPELVGSYLAIVLSPRVMPYFQEGRFYPFFRRFQLACFAGCVVIFVLALLSLRSGLPMLLPKSFGRSLNVFMILLPGALAGLATFPLTISFLMFVRPRFLFAMDCVTAPVMAILYVYGIQTHGAIGAAWVTSVSRFAKAAIAQVVAWRWASREPGVVLSGSAPVGVP